MDQCTSTNYSTCLNYGFLFKSMFCSYDYIINNFYSIFKLWTKSSEILLSVYALLFPALHPNRDQRFYNTSCLVNQQFTVFITPPISTIRKNPSNKYVGSDYMIRLFILSGVIKVLNEHDGVRWTLVIRGINCYPIFVITLS